jgi:hypothetical protein
LVQSGVFPQDIRHANQQRQRLRQQRQTTIDCLDLDETIQMFVGMARYTKKIMVQLWRRRQCEKNYHEHKELQRCH